MAYCDLIVYIEGFKIKYHRCGGVAHKQNDYFIVSLFKYILLKLSNHKYKLKISYKENYKFLCR